MKKESMGKIRAYGGNFAQNVQAVMRDKGMSLRELCRRAGIDPSFLSKVFSGKRNPPCEQAMLEKLAEALDMSEEEIFVSAGKIPPKWSRIQSDKTLREKVKRLIEDGTESGGAASAVNLPPKSRHELEDELL